MVRCEECKGLHRYWGNCPKCSILKKKKLLMQIAFVISILSGLLWNWK